MKNVKFLSVMLLLVLLVLSVAVACDSGSETGDSTDAITTGGVTEPETEKTPEADIVDEDGNTITDTDLHAWFAYGTNLTRRDKFSVESNDSIAISMAKNEMEGFQLLLASTVGYEGLRCEVSDLSDGNGHTLTGEVNVTFNTIIKSAGKSAGHTGFTPTAFMSQDDSYVGGTFDIIAGRSKTLYILYKTDANTVPGTYTGRLEVKQGDDILFAGDISVTVWDIYYDEATEGIHMFGYGFSWDNWEKPAPDGAPEMDYDLDMMEAYADALVNYRMTPYRLPVGEHGVLDERAAKYLDNPRVSLTVLWGGQQKDLSLQYYEAEERGWLDKISFLEYDEPHEEGHMDVIFRDVKDINRRFPTTKHFNALNVNLVKDGQNIIERLAPISTIHCIVQQAFEGDVVDSMLKLKEERGDTIMWYVCGSEPANMIDGLPCIPGTQKRILFWSQYLHNLDGFLYWQTCYWEGQDNIWADDYESQRIRPVGANEPATGEGVYFYWHPETKMPVYTIGLDAMRDGIEDFQLLRMAEEVLGKEAVMNFVKEVVSSRIDFTKDDGVLMAVRNELAAALVAATAA
jgi:hypothetical protein